MKTKLLALAILIIIGVFLFKNFTGFEKLNLGRYENDVKDSWITLYDDNTFTATITYSTTDGGSIAMKYYGTYSQKSSSKLKLVFNIKNNTEKRKEYWKIDKENNSLIDDNRYITFNYCEE